MAHPPRCAMPRKRLPSECSTHDDCAPTGQRSHQIDATYGGRTDTAILQTTQSKKVYNRDVYLSVHISLILNYPTNVQNNSQPSVHTLFAVMPQSV